MWKNIGKQLQAFAYILFWISAGITLVGSVCFLIGLEGVFGKSGIVALFASIPISAVIIALEYVTSLFLIGFGKIVEAKELEICKNSECNPELISNREYNSDKNQ